ncbi:MAG TPA: hypothetical protein VJ719_16500 [Chthoniobacterales bacterium]|nr:hypothetical protein [Chthoniobacterales bacterium]
MSFRIPIHRVNWTTSAFLIGTFFLTLTAVPLYLWHFGFDWFYFAVFAVSLALTGFSISLGYHRLFSHMTFRAKLPVRLLTLIFGAGAFENSALMWASEHRRHHKHVDHDDDPYDITKGFFHAHIGWLLFKLWPEPPFDNVADLKRDPLDVAKPAHPLACGVDRFGCACIVRRCLGRMGWRPGRVSHRRRGKSSGAPALHIPD